MSFWGRLDNNFLVLLGACFFFFGGSGASGLPLN